MKSHGYFDAANGGGSMSSPDHLKRMSSADLSRTLAKAKSLREGDMFGQRLSSENLSFSHEASKSTGSSIAPLSHRISSRENSDHGKAQRKVNIYADLLLWLTSQVVLPVKKRPWTAEEEDAMTRFVSSFEITKLLIYVDGGNKIHVTSTEMPFLYAIPCGMYFIKMEGKVTIANVNQKIIRGTFTSSRFGGLDSLHRSMALVYQASLTQSMKWRDGVRNEFKKHYHRFMAALVESTNYDKAKTVLYTAEEDLEDVQMAVKDKELIQRLESAVIHWTRQIKNVLANHEDINRSDTTGPLEEIEFWRSRALDLTGISDQVNSPDLQKVLRVLELAGSQYLKPFMTLANMIHDGASQANENLTFLSSLSSPCEAIEAADLDSLAPLMPAVLLRVRMIWSLSTFFNTDERIISLLGKLSCQIVNKCKSALLLLQLFTGNIDDISKSLESCINCGLRWRDAYHGTKAAIQRAHSDNTSRHWRFDDANVFAQSDAFIQRCRDLYEICRARDQFELRPRDGEPLTAERFGGPRAAETVKALGDIRASFLEELDLIQTSKYDILDVNMSRWHQDFNKFKLAVKDFEYMLQNVINVSFEGLTNISEALHQLEAFADLAKTSSIHRTLERKASDIFQLFLTQTVAARASFDSLRKSPPLLPTEPSFAGSVIWVRGIGARIRRDWEQLQAAVAKGYLAKVPELEEAETACTTVLSSLDDYAQNRYQSWLATVQSLDLQSLFKLLDKPLIRRMSEKERAMQDEARRSYQNQAAAMVDSFLSGDGTATYPGSGEGEQNPNKMGSSGASGFSLPLLVVNFDPFLQRLFAEVFHWQRLQGKFTVPFVVHEICSQREKFRVMSESVTLLVRGYNSIVQSLANEEQRLFADHMKRLDKRISQGMVKLTWNAKSTLELYVRDCHQLCQETMELVKRYNEGREKIELICKSISNSSTVHLERNYVYEELEFEARQKDFSLSAREILLESYKQVIRTLKALQGMFQEASADAHNEWKKFVQRVDRALEQSLRQAVRRSLQEISKAINGDHGNEPQGMFKAYVMIDDKSNQVTMRPPVLQLAQNVDNSCRDLLKAQLLLPRITKSILMLQEDQLDELLAFLPRQTNTVLSPVPLSTDKPYSTGLAPVPGSPARRPPKEGGLEGVEEGEDGEGEATIEPTVLPALYNLPILTPSTVNSKGEDSLQAGVAFSDGPVATYFGSISTDEDVAKILIQIVQGISGNNRQVQKHTSYWEAKYSYLWTIDRASYMRRYEKAKKAPSSFEADITRYLEQKLEILAEENLMHIQSIVVDCTRLKDSLVQHCVLWQQSLTTLLNHDATTQLTSMHELFIRNTKALSEMPYSLEELSSNLALLQEMKAQEKWFETQFQVLDEIYSYLAKFEVQVPDEELQQLAALRPAGKQFMEFLDEAAKMLEKSKVNMKRDLEGSLASVKKQASDLKMQGTKALPYSPDIPEAQAAAAIEEFKTKVEACRQKSQALLPGMTIFNIEFVEPSELLELDRDLHLLSEVWTLSEGWNRKWSTWRLSVFSEVNIEEMETEAANFAKQIAKLGRDIKSWKIWVAMREKIDQFRQTVPLIQDLKNPAMRRRHWDLLRGELSQQFDPESRTFTLERVFALGLHMHAALIGDISANANKELVIETALAAIAKKWNEAALDIVPYKASYYKIRSTDDLNQMLEDDQVALSTMKSSKFYPSFKEEISHWERKLTIIAEVIEIMLQVQRQWMYLENIFVSSEDIRKQLPTETALFDEVNKELKALMALIASDPRVVLCCVERELMKPISAMDTSLQTIQKSLDHYLEAKRMIFPRFYFLSNEDLLEILGQAKDPSQVQKHIKKCFEGIKSLQLDVVTGPSPSANSSQLTTPSPGEDKRGHNSDERAGAGSQAHEKRIVASAMVAPDGEMVRFSDPVPIQGAVELWLVQVELKMQRTLQNLLAESLQSSKGRKEQWIKDWQGQLIITVGQIVWTADCHKALSEMGQGDRGALKQSKKKQVAFLNRMADMVRSPLTKIQRAKLVALITVEIHNRDVMERMMKANCESTTDFEWISQLRFIFARDVGPSGTCQVKQLNAQLEYSYEYQGNNGRLVITPLTDRCILTLVMAMHLHRGGNPLGPAGTGKTETVKDLGKSLAKYVIVINCSDGLDYKSVGRMFCGLAQCGAWGCFDEFNRIDIEVLSVVAMQILSIMTALSQKLPQFVFMGQTIKLNPNCGIFITMNPGYAGRTELPDNLKALMRPVAMMTPDLALIAEVMLQAEGFKEARVLAKKTVTLYSLMVQQLSKQDHYDYGLRNLKAVLNCAGAFKREDPEMNEDAILMTALRDMNVPKFIEDDLRLFKLLLSDLFPSLDLPPDEPGPLHAAIGQELRKASLQQLPFQVDKMIQLSDSKATRHSNMLVGKTCTGKSTIWKILSRALTALSKDSGHTLPLSPGPNTGSVATTDPAGAGEGSDTKPPIPSKISTQYHPVAVLALNPKSITLNELYGAYNLATFEWSDGVISTLFRQCAQAEKAEEKWILFDGPVDTSWIESMNSVMDDNKVLTLINGDRIAMTASMSLLFEVEDLSVASPATVSRAGMVYIDPSVLSWQPFVQTWLSRVFSTRPDTQSSTGASMSHYAELQAFHLKLFEKYVGPMLEYKRQTCKEEVPVCDISAIQSLCHLYEALHTAENGLDPFGTSTAASSSTTTAAEGATAPAAAADLVSYWPLAEKWFVFAMIWTVMATTDDRGRQLLDAKLRDLETLFPPVNTVYDYVVDPKKKDWELWEVSVPAWRAPRNMNFFQMIVPTVDTVRNAFVVQASQVRGNSGRHVLLLGGTGVGKSVLANSFLGGLPDSSYASVSLNFSAATLSSTTQEILESVMEKRAKDRFGPAGGRRLIAFIDDLNLPRKDKFGAQPALELLRQWMDYEGWYDRVKCQWKHILDMQILAAMAPPNGGRASICSRLVSRFHLLNMTAPDNSQVQRIFESILSCRLAEFEEDIRRIGPLLVKATIEIYSAVSTKFLPTPMKSHYTFNLRDVSKVLQGLLRANKKQNDSKESLLRLWVHECTRIFADRFLFDAQEDHKVFQTLLGEVLHHEFGVSWSQLMSSLPAGLSAPLFAGFVSELPALTPSVSTAPAATKKSTSTTTAAHSSAQNAAATQRPSTLPAKGPGSGAESVPGHGDNSYGEVASLDSLRAFLGGVLEDYNNEPKLIPMPLVLFRDAILNICIVHRILTQPRGNAMLVGVGGSGRRSSARLAAYLASYPLFSIDITSTYRLTEFKEDLKKLYTAAGASNKPTVFLFADTQLKEEAFLEDINNILSSGQVPGLFTKEEIPALLDAVRGPAKTEGLPDSPKALWDYFIQRVRANLHVVLCMSPVGAGFRNRCRMYPALVNCTTINWFHEWPATALEEVAMKYLDDMKLADGAAKKNLSAVFAACHVGVARASERMMLQLSRKNHVTPTHYLELVKGYRALLREKDKELGDSRDKLRNGLSKLEESRVQVLRMSEELSEKKKVVAVSQKECEELLVVIVSERRVADEQRKQVEAESEQITKEEVDCKAIAQDAQRDLDVALPALEKAMAEVDKLDKSAISEVKAYSKPPKAVETVLNAVMLLFGLKSDWPTAKKKISEGNFLQQIKAYDKDNVSNALIMKLKKYTDDPEFNTETVRGVSAAAAALCSWVCAIFVYANVFREVAPKRERLQAAEQGLKAKQAALSKAKSRLEEVVAKVNQLKEKYDQSVGEKNRLRKEAEELELKLTRADKLVKGLAGEYTRWQESIALFDAQVHNLLGDSLLASAFLSYAGPFDTSYRDGLLQKWQADVRAKEIPVSETFSVTKFLAKPTDVRQWNLQGLPNDSFSTENGVIVTRGNRWPLMIDPQGQANKWIRAMEAKNLKVIDLKMKDFLREVENAIQYGLPVLLQDVLEELDPSLEPVLSKSVLKVGSREVIRIGDSEIEFSRDFKFYITTKLANPHFTPEVSTKVAVVNFAVKQQGLEAQLLGQVVQAEEPELEDMKSELTMTVAAGKTKLVDLENQILKLLSEAKGSLLDDEHLVSTLQQSKVTAEEVSRQLKVAEETEQRIDLAREAYRSSAVRAAILYFVLDDLSRIDPMYQFSLDSYVDLFRQSISQSRMLSEDEEVMDRNWSINAFHTYAVYASTCLGLFARHKLLFAFQMCTQILRQEGKLLQEEYTFLLTGGTVLDRSNQPPNPAPEIFQPKMWDSITELSSLAAFSGLAGAIEQSTKVWKEWYSSPQPEQTPLPADWNMKLGDFQKMLLLRALRPDRLLFAANRFVASVMGAQYAEPPALDLAQVLEQSSPSIPLVFVLSPGVDPTAQVSQLASAMNMPLEVCALGQGQAPVATRLLKEAMAAGKWVFLSNCHLMLSWMPTLEKIVEALSSRSSAQPISPQFRLWLSSAPHPRFPISILQRGLKITTEPPRGLKSNLLQMYNLISEDRFNACKEGSTYKKLIFSLAWFHSILLERRKFKSLGWNTAYDFNASDFSICHDLIATFLEAYPEHTPFEALRYLIAEANYGGRVTDDWDRRLVVVYVNQFICTEAVTEPQYKLSSLSEYFIPHDGSLESYKEYIRGLPITEQPSAFGQHPNADISSQIEETNELLDTIFSLQPSVVTEAGETRETKILRMVKSLEEQLCQTIDTSPVTTPGAVRKESEPLKTVLLQECERYNKLLTTMRKHLLDVDRAVQGLVVITMELEQVCDALLGGKVPSAWSFCYPSIKPLGSWMNDLKERCEQMGKWVQKGMPSVFWLSGFTYPTGFLTALLQTTARKNGLPIDTLGWDFPVLKEDVYGLRDGPPAAEGAYVQGLYLEGARWDSEVSCLADALPMELYCPMPVIHFKPIENKRKPAKGYYSCPIYMYPVRSGTRERPSFMIAADLRAGQMDGDFWTKRGVALLLSLGN